MLLVAAAALAGPSVAVPSDEAGRPAAGTSQARADDGPASAPAEDELLAALERAVDAPSPAARTAAAKALAARPEATVDVLVSAARLFGRFAPAPAGARTEKVPLWNGTEIEEDVVAVHVPASYDPARPAPLLLALHGAGGDGAGELPRWTALGDALGMIVVAPTDRAADQGYEYTEAERTRALSALRWARRRHNVDENRVFVCGVSRGGHLAWDLSLRRPDVFAAVIPLIGGPRLANARGECNLRFIENLARVPIRDLQGAGDDPLLLDNLRIAFERLVAYKAADAKLVVQEGRGHDFDLAAVDWKAWLAGVRRDPSPATVVRRAIHPAEGRAFWAEVLAVGKGAKSEIRPEVDAKAWAKMDSGAQRRAFVAWAEKVTARLEVRRSAPGVFAAFDDDVDRFRLLLADGTFDPAKPVVVSFRGKEVKATPKRDASVLLADFVERFDRTYLPVAEVVVR